MSISVADPVAVAIRCDDEHLWVTLSTRCWGNLPSLWLPNAQGEIAVQASY